MHDYNDPKEQAKIKFLNNANLLADQYGLKINWKRTDYEKGILDFDGNPGEDAIMNFITALEQLGDIE